MKNIKLFARLLFMAAFAIVVSCTDEPKNEEQQETPPESNLKTEILTGGVTSGGAVYSKIDATTFWLDYIKYEIVDSHLEIIGYDKVELPAEPKLYAEVTIDGAVLKTRTIGEDAFKGSKMVKLNLPQTITSISKYAFKNCTSLESVFIPEGIISLPSLCFYDCTSLTSIKLPKSLLSLPCCCFLGCTSLKSINIPEGVTSVENGCFALCTSLASVTFPKGLTKLGVHIIGSPSILESAGCFAGCTSLTSISLPEGVTSIGHGCFSGCTSLTSINLPEGVTSIEHDCFSGCTSLTSINLPEGLTSIGKYCFYGCSAMSSIKLPNGIISINLSCFKKCDGLASISLPSSIQKIYTSHSDDDYLEDVCLQKTLIFNSLEPPFIDWGFGHHYLADMAYVPKMSLDKYKSRYSSYIKKIRPLE